MSRNLSTKIWSPFERSPPSQQSLLPETKPSEIHVPRFDSTEKTISPIQSHNESTKIKIEPNLKQPASKEPVEHTDVCKPSEIPRFESTEKTISPKQSHNESTKIKIEPNLKQPASKEPVSRRKKIFGSIAPKKYLGDGSGDPKLFKQITSRGILDPKYFELKRLCCGLAYIGKKGEKMWIDFAQCEDHKYKSSEDSDNNDSILDDDTTSSQTATTEMEVDNSTENRNTITEQERATTIEESTSTTNSKAKRTILGQIDPN